MGVDVAALRRRVFPGSKDSMLVGDDVDAGHFLRGDRSLLENVHNDLDRPDDEDEMILGQNLVRLARGKMLGVDFNKDFTWVGSSIGIYPS